MDEETLKVIFRNIHERLQNVEHNQLIDSRKIEEIEKRHERLVNNLLAGGDIL